MKLICKFKFLTLLMIILIVGETLINVYAGYSVGSILNARNKTVNEIVIISIYVAITFIGAILVTFLFNIVSNWYFFKIITYFRKNIAINVSTFSYNRFIKKNIGEYISTFNKNPEIIFSKTIVPLFSLINGLAIFVSSSIFIALLNPFLLLWSLLMSSVIFILPLLFQKYYGLSNEKLLIANNNYSNVLTLLFNSFKTLFIFNKKSLLVTKINEASIVESKAVLKNKIILDSISNINSILSVIVQIVIVGLSVYYFRIGFTSLGAVLSMSFLYQPLLNGIRKIVSSIFQISASKNLYKNFNKEFKASKKTNISLSEFKKITVNDYKKNIENKILLSVNNFQILNNEKIAILGDSGCGKTTFLSGICNIENDYDGKILINSIDFKQNAPHSFVNNIAYLNQNSYIFNDSILFNITLGSFFDQQKWNKIVKICQLEKFIASKSEKEKFLFTENGQNLSGGQKQRIAIARALYSDREILFLDESLSQVDMKTAQLIENSLLKLNKTIVFISHRFTKNFLDKIDKVYQIKNAVLKELKG